MPETDSRTAKLARRTGDDAAPAAVDDEVPVEEHDDEAAEAPRPVRPRAKPAGRGARGTPTRQRVLVGALVVALIAGLVAVVVFTRQWYDQRQTDAAHEQAVAAAKQVTVNFMSISASTVDRDLKRIAAGATGEFRDEFSRGMGEVRATVVENKVDSHATILQAGLVSGGRDSAVVLVAVDATVKNAHAPDGRLAHYRIQVDVARDARSGAWLVSRLQFVG